MSFKTIEVESEADASGIVRLEIPVDDPNRRYRLIVLVESETQPPRPREWPEGFFERTYGQWHGELERAPQGQFEKREDL